jgi:hypothetical protein
LSASGPVVPESATPKKAETKYCREMGNASSRLYAVKVCKTRAQWRRWENCHGSSTRYCTPKKKAVQTAALGRETAFPLNENSRIVCREVKETGTRIVVQQTCLPKREWDRMWIENSEGLRDLQGDHSKLNRGGPQ